MIDAALEIPLGAVLPDDQYRCGVQLRAVELAHRNGNLGAAEVECNDHR